MPDMRRLAKRVVDSVPGVQAAILFGSRARKTARRDSDWDVVLLAPERYKKEVLRTAPRIPAVSYVSLSPQRLRERRNHLGTLERSVVRDGVLLAGEWIMPKSQTKPTVNCEDLANGLQVTADQINLAVTHLGSVIKRQTNYGDNTLGGLSQYSAERLAKSALLHLGIDPPHSHDALKLAEALRKEHPRHAWIEAIESFNGNSAEHHVADYDGKILESTDASVARLCNALEFYGEVIEAVEKKRLKFKAQLLTICDNIVDIVSSLQRDDIDWEKYPNELKQHLLQWKQMAMRYLSAEATSKRCEGK